MTNGIGRPKKWPGIEKRSMLLVFSAQWVFNEFFTALKELNNGH